jgi:hypothetical protein
MSKYLKKRYTWLGIIAVITCVLSYFKLIDSATSMYIVGVALGWSWGYDYHKEKTTKLFEVLAQSCAECDDTNNSNNDEEQ